MRKNMKLEQDMVTVEEFMLEQETDLQMVPEDCFETNPTETKWNNKKKISRKTIIVRIAIGFILLGIAGGASWFFLFGNQAQADSDEVAIVLEDGQELMIGEITSIIGNEVVVDLVEEEIVDTSTQTEDGTARPSGMGAPADGQMPEGMEAPADGQMPEGMEAPTGDSTEETTDDTQTSSAKDAAISDNLTSSDTSYSIVSVSTNQQSMPSGEMPSDMQMPSGEMPSGMEMPEDMGTDSTTETTDSADATQSEDTTEEVDTTVTYYNSLGESKSLQIPVGTEVITKLGTVTTFSRLAVGDVIKVVMSSSGSDSYIVKIYIVD